MKRLARGRSRARLSGVSWWLRSLMPARNGGLEEAHVGGGDRVPAQGVEVGGEGTGRIEAALGVRPVQHGLKDARAQLDLPEHFQSPPLVVVVEAGEDDAAGLVRLGRGDDS